ncbi:MAG: 4-phosphoerythronate dehydrogenase [Melioribacteraceae bacterium]|nr:4-phosphoerythronate dehydrogenase [Melioribacteraceae bacterium]MCF8356096.1 4-phosphoerythronate dehydrogenase [Melioribacteraceae bacterium]MCF8395580.1 4-phosphoerythronate dehydrogenase [Melioribacteraceae bacterium]MCF8419682.1 4-phosphoerythronate dehydrogenase [Melioribacteraceae bacterium]
MLIIVDENIAYGKEAFSRFGDVILMHGREITNEILKDADALIIRSITNVNEKLLNGTSVRFVGTATIGTDHVDVEYLEQNNIGFASAPGCNSWAVTEYVLSALVYLSNRFHFSLSEKSIGVIGVGNIGSKVAATAEALGLKVIKNDPPKQREGGSGFVGLDETLTADIITLHVPLNMDGEDKTHHLIDEQTLAKVKPGAILINSSRGAVVDNTALLNKLQNDDKLITVLDVWESEPEINLDLLSNVELGTPHVAGYTLEGKVNGTIMIYESICRQININPTWKPDMPKADNELIDLDGLTNKETILKKIFDQIYPIDRDDKMLKRLLDESEISVEKYFDKLRKNYPLRRELCNYTAVNYSPEIEPLLKSLRMKLI